jgi:hypothetical protein
MIEPSVERGFLRNLKALDKRLGVKFNGNNFVITYDRGYGEPVNMCMVKTDDGGFRQPDMREIAFLKAGDMENKRIQDKLAETAKYMYEVRETAKRKSSELIRERTKDDRIQLMSAFNMVHGAGKKTPAFRRI